jgi:hypothetical protein
MDKQCVLNQIQNYWFLSYVLLHFLWTLPWKLRCKKSNLKSIIHSKQFPIGIGLLQVQHVDSSYLNTFSCFYYLFPSYQSSRHASNHVRSSIQALKLFMSLLRMMQWHKVLWENMIKNLSCPCSYMCTSTWIMWMHLLAMKIIWMKFISLVSTFLMNMQFPLLEKNK